MIFMQLWSEPNQWLKAHPNPQARLRVKCFDVKHHQQNAKNQATGYAGRLKSIEHIKAGSKAFAALSAPPSDRRGPGVWARYADLGRVYPVLTVEAEECGDVYVLLGPPGPASTLTHLHG